MKIRNRIVGHGEEQPEQLLANPSNYRRHPGAQLDALRGSLAEIGWLKSVIVNRRTGHVIDGHARVEEAMRQGSPKIPVTYVDVSLEEEKLGLTVLDPMTEMADHDEEALHALLDDIQTEDAGLQKLLEDLATKPRVPAGIQVEEVDFSQVQDTFWLSVRGPLPSQLDALRKLKEALEALPGVEVDIGVGR